MTSTSRLTASPTAFCGMMIFCCVKAISMKLKVPRSASTSHTVRLVPSTQMKPFGTMYGSKRAGGRTVT